MPALLRRVWEVDNFKEQLLWEMGNQGGISGDCFVKVVWEPAAPDIGQAEPRVRILPLNSSFCFPEWHPHDRSRLLRFKLKYKFWATSAEGTRQVYTYTEILTDSVIEEYVNDELLYQGENPLGVIPVVHIPNIPVSGSPWGLADIQDVLSLNREYNEKATDVSDIINYHAAPVTIITGAKASNLEKGSKKVWGGLPTDAKVFNLENGIDLAGPMQYLELLKRAMHEMTGVPESALGQIQPISNTSGVALAIQYQPMMQRYNLKKLQYTVGILKINEFILRTLALYWPERFVYDPLTEGILQEGQPLALDLEDPLTYQTECHWPTPLPLDALIKLQEISQKMALGIESKRGALRDLGEEFPDEKVQEIFDELVREAKETGALEMIKAQINSVIVATTGMTPADAEPPAPPAGNSEGGEGDSKDDQGNPAGPGPVNVPSLLDIGGAPSPRIQNLMNELVTQAYGPRVPLRRTPDND